MAQELKPEVKPKKKNHNWSMAEFMNSIRDHIGRLMDNTGPRDLIYIAAYVAAVKLAYDTQKGLSAALGLNLPKVLHHYVIPVTEEEKQTVKEKEEELDVTILLRSMVIAYILLKIDASDITSAITKITSAIASVGVA